jgi:Uma2 family endonuclease
VASNDAGVVLREDPDTVVGPDVAYYTDANTFEDVHPKWGDVPPVLAVEVQSPNDKMREVMAKVAEYLQNGVRTVWLVNYEERFLTVFDVGQPPVIVNEADPVPALPNLPGFSHTLSDFFRLPGQPVTTPSA